MAVQYNSAGVPLPPRPMSPAGPRPPMGSGPRPMGARPPMGRRPFPSSHTPQLRKNERIRALEVRVIGHDGKHLGILPTREALRIAQAQALDLVEVSPGERPPVCKVLDYGKFMYEEGKKQKHHKPHASKLKEVKFRPRIELHDYETKLRHVEEFLFHGDKVKLTLFFKGREMEHKELGFETMKRVLADLTHVGTADQPPRLFGRNINTTLSPLPPNKRKWKHNLREDGSPPHGHTHTPRSHEHDHERGHTHDHDHGHDHGHAAPPPSPPAAASATPSDAPSPAPAPDPKPPAPGA